MNGHELSIRLSEDAGDYDIDPTPQLSVSRGDDRVKMDSFFKERGIPTGGRNIINRYNRASLLKKGYPVGPVEFPDTSR